MMSVNALYSQLEHPDENQRLQAAQALTVYPSAKTTEVLIQALGDDEAVVIGAAMDTLTGFGDTVCAALYQHLSTDTPRVRLGIAELLERFPSQASENALRAALEDGNAQVRGAAVRSLGVMLPLQKATVQSAEQLLTDADPFPRYQALTLLQKIDTTSQHEATVLKNDLAAHSVDDRRAALSYIREHHKTEWVTAVRTLLKDADPSIQQASQWTLERLEAEHVDS